MDDRAESSIHSLIYWAVCETCYDREYIYRAFVKHYTQISRRMFVDLPSPETGEYTFNGIKSNRSVSVRWRFARRLNWCGSNHVTLTVTITDQIRGGGQTRCGVFNVNTGRNVEEEDFI